MKCWCDNNEVPLIGITTHDDLAAYYSYVEVLSQVRLGTNKPLFLDINGKKSKYYCLSARFEPPAYRHVMVNDSVYQLLCKPTKQFTGDADLKTLVSSKMGYPYFSTIETSSTHWMLPPMKLMTFIDTITNFIKVPNGGGARIYVNSFGQVNFIDLKKSFDTGKPIYLEGNVQDDTSDNEWYLSAPGIVNFATHDSEKFITDQFIIDKDTPQAGYRKSINNDKYYDCVKQMLLNDYYRAFYTSRKVIVSVAPGCAPTIGTMVMFNGSDAKLMVSEITMTMEDEDGMNNYTTLTLVGCHQ